MWTWSDLHHQPYQHRGGLESYPRQESQSQESFAGSRLLVPTQAKKVRSGLPLVSQDLLYRHTSTDKNSHTSETQNLRVSGCLQILICLGIFFHLNDKSIFEQCHKQYSDVTYFSAIAYSPGRTSLSRIRNTPSFMRCRACSASIRDFFPRYHGYPLSRSSKPPVAGRPPLAVGGKSSLFSSPFLTRQLAGTSPLFPVFNDIACSRQNQNTMQCECLFGLQGIIQVMGESQGTPLSL